MSIVSRNVIMLLLVIVGFSPKAEANTDSTPPYSITYAHLIPAPNDPSRWPAWREKLHQLRQQMLHEMQYDDSLYQRKEFAWVSSCFCCCFAMMCDETFYDHKSNQYQIDSFMEHGQSEFGGYDAVVLWHAYPRIGFGPRNQFDFYRDMPGGLAGLREVSQRIHQHNAKVFINYNPWDTGTRREAKSDVDVLVDLVKQIEADGIFLDTLHEGGSGFRDKLDAARTGVVLESELTLPPKRIFNHHMSWAQWFKDSSVPGVLGNKWLERRHMMHQIKRWDHDHTSELHMAWMNGSGMMVWENVFGSWRGWNPRDRSILRIMLPIQRRYVDLFTSDKWTPLIPAKKADVYASIWENNNLKLWTLVNRSHESVQGIFLKVPHVRDYRYFDLIRGCEITQIRNETAFLEGRILARGIGAFLAVSEQTLGDDFQLFLSQQKKRFTEFNLSISNSVLQEKWIKPKPTRKYQANELPESMVAITPKPTKMKFSFRNRECGWHKITNQPNFPRYPKGGHHRTLTYTQKVSLKPYAIDITLVTNTQYAKFLNATGYTPKIRRNFLKHWQNDKPPTGKEDHPVVYVDMEDARAYAHWVGKRLPTVYKWQYAAQGTGGCEYPWGDKWKENYCNCRQIGDTTPVKAYPSGCSPFGCYDMCGNVWERTESEYYDSRTRFCILKGGSYYQAKGSDWYADGGAQPCHFGVKYLLMYPGLDRCATIGFRCVVDLKE